MKNRKKRCLRTILVTLLVLFVAMCYCYCPHEITRSEIVQKATCTETGIEEILCEQCDKVLESKTIEKTNHKFTDYEVKIKPNADGPGLESRTCQVCSKKEQREYFCKHEVNQEEGWKYTKYATPSEKGKRYKSCYICGAKLYEEYNMPEIENNSIYIVGTNIQKSFVITSFTQSAVDSYDIVYTTGTKLGSNNPFVLGHNYGTLGYLYQTKVGTYIYLNINGKIEIYEVIVSEYGLQNAEKDDIIGQTTGTSIWDSYPGKTLHMYTCYGSIKDGRWMVLAKQIL